MKYWLLTLEQDGHFYTMYKQGESAVSVYNAIRIDANDPQIRLIFAMEISQADFEGMEKTADILFRT